MDVTAEDMARWPDETRVLWDMACERGRVEIYAERDADAALHIKNHKVKPYHVRRALMTIEPATYDLWANGNPFEQPKPFSAELFERWERMRLHPECPLRGCEEFDLRQAEVPVAGEGEWAPFRRILAEQDRQDAVNLAAAINAPPSFRVGDILDVAGVNSPAPLRIIGIDQARATITLASGEVFGVEPAPPTITVTQPKKVRDREALQAARPKRRLDGRRA